MDATEQVEKPPEAQDKPVESADATKEAEAASNKAATQVYDELRKEKSDGQTASDKAAAPAEEKKPEEESWWSGFWNGITGGDSKDVKVQETDDRFWGYSDQEWSNMFSWSNDKGGTTKGNGTWLDDLGDWFDMSNAEEIYPTDQAKGGGQEAADASCKWSENVLKDFDKGALEHFLQDPSQPGDKTAFEELSDGTKIAKDGSWIEFSEQAKQQMAEKAGERVTHTLKDSHGRDVTIEVADGHVTHKAADGTTTEITDQQVVSTDAKGNRRVIDKATGRIEVTDAQSGDVYVQEGEKALIRKANGSTLERTGDSYVVRDKEGASATFTKEVFRRHVEGGLELVASLVGDDRPVAAPTRLGDIAVQKTNKGMRATDHEGNVLEVGIDGNGKFTSKDGTEVLIDRYGHARMKSGETYVDVTSDNVPHGLFVDEDGFVRLKNMKFTSRGVESTNGARAEVAEDGNVDVTDCRGRRHVMRMLREGLLEIANPNGAVDRVDTEKKTVQVTESNGTTYNYDAQKDEVETDGNVMRRTETQMASGDIIRGDEVITNNGDHLKSTGAVEFADGTTVSADGVVHTADGKTYDAHFESGPKGPEATAQWALAIAASIAGKGDISASDIAALQAILGAIGPQLKTLTDMGDMGGYAKLKAAEGTVLEALSRAQAQQHPQGNQGQQTNQPGAPNTKK